MTTQMTLFDQSSKPWKPIPYQKKALKFLVENAGSGLFLDPGLGKTSITLAAIKFLLAREIISKVLIIAPLRVCYSVWPKEIAKWEDFSKLKFAVLHGPDKDEALKQDANVFIINPEGLDWLLDVKKTRTPFGKIKVDVDIRRWKALGFDTLVVDELTKFKHTNTSRFKALKLVLGTFARRWGLTGSPLANGYMDLFGQCYVLDLGRALGQYITHYRTKYFDADYSGFNWTLKEGADQEISKRIAPMVLRMASEDYLDLPQLVTNTIEVTLPKAAAKIYDRLWNDYIAKIDENVVTASTAAVASVKCRQIVCGGIYLEDCPTDLIKNRTKGREWVNVHYEKADALVDLIESLQGSPLLVAYDFIHDIDRIRERLNLDVPYIGGGVSAKRAAELEVLWNQGKLPVLLGHPQSIAFGLNLQDVGKHVCFHSLTWNYELYDQFIRRVLRQGNRHKRVTVHHIVAPGTVDDAMVESINCKDKGQKSFFSAIKKLKKKIIKQCTTSNQV